jgi:hypothetical protein
MNKIMSTFALLIFVSAVHAADTQSSTTVIAVPAQNPGNVRHFQALAAASACFLAGNFLRVIPRFLALPLTILAAASSMHPKEGFTCLVLVSEEASDAAQNAQKMLQDRHNKRMEQRCNRSQNGMTIACMMRPQYAQVPPQDKPLYAQHE